MSLPHKLEATDSLVGHVDSWIAPTAASAASSTHGPAATGLARPGIHWAKIEQPPLTAHHNGVYHAWDANGEGYCGFGHNATKARKSRDYQPARACRHCIKKVDA